MMLVGGVQHALIDGTDSPLAASNPAWMTSNARPSPPGGYDPDDPALVAALERGSAVLPVLGRRARLGVSGHFGAMEVPRVGLLQSFQRPARQRRDLDVAVGAPGLKLKGVDNSWCANPGRERRLGVNRDLVDCSA
jgi:hypothetical protein